MERKLIFPANTIIRVRFKIEFFKWKISNQRFNRQNTNRLMHKIKSREEDRCILKTRNRKFRKLIEPRISNYKYRDYIVGSRRKKIVRIGSEFS